MPGSRGAGVRARSTAGGRWPRSRSTCSAGCPRAVAAALGLWWREDQVTDRLTAYLASAAGLAPRVSR